MSIFDEFNEEGIEALRPTNRTFLNLPETSGNVLDAIAFSGSGGSFPEVQSLFKDSPFGVAWDAAIYKDDELTENTSIAVRYVVTVSNDARRIKDKFANEVVDDDVIKLYLIVQDKKPIDYYKPADKDLRLANIRYSNIAEIVGFVIGDAVVEAVDDDSYLYQEYIDKYVRSFTESKEDITLLKDALSGAFDDYLENPRSNFFKRSFIGNLIKTELKRELQEFWKPILGSLAREIRSVKIQDEKYWQPYTASGDLKEDNQYTPIFPVAEAAQEAGLFFNGVIKQFEFFDAIIADYLDINTLKSKPDVVLFKESGKNSILIKIFKEIYEFFKGIVSFVKEGLVNFIEGFVDSAFTLNAFFVGVYNGVINFIASLVDLLSFFAGFLSGDSEQVFETFRKEFEKLKEAGFFTYIYEQLTKFFDKVSNRYDTSQAKYVISKNLGEDIFKIFEVLIAVYSGVQVVKGAARTIKGLRKQVDDTIELSSRNIDELDATLKFPEDTRRFIKSARLIDDLAPKIVKDIEKGIKIEKNEFIFAWSQGKGFKSKKAVTSGAEDYVRIADLFGKGVKLTKERIEQLKDAIITHNHPNNSRFSNDDIKTFLEFELQELRAIGDNGIIYSLKKTKQFDQSIIKKIYKEMEIERSKLSYKLTIEEGRRDYDKIGTILEDFEERFILERTQEFLEYIIFQ